MNSGIILATMLTIIYLYYYCFCLHSRDQTKIERARYGKNRKSVEDAVEEQRHKAGVIADYKKELDRALEQVKKRIIASRAKKNTHTHTHTHTHTQSYHH